VPTRARGLRPRSLRRTPSIQQAVFLTVPKRQLPSGHRSSASASAVNIAAPSPGQALPCTRASMAGRVSAVVPTDRAVDLERIGIHSVGCQQSKKFRFAPDAPLEGEGFEPSVPHRGEPFRDRAGTWSSRRHGCFLNTRTDTAEMDRATLSYNPPLERAIFRRLTRAPTLMLHSMPVPGPWVVECSLDSSRSQ
jgi:hypothetical protein